MANDNRRGNQAQPGGFVPANTGSSRGKSGFSARTAQPSADLGGAAQYSRNSLNYQVRQHGMSTGRKVAVGIVIVALVAAVAGLAYYVYKEMRKSAINEDLHSMSEEEMQAVDNELTGLSTFTEPFTVLLLGSDARAGDPEMGARTDTIILVRVDPVENQVSMVSVPRDTMVQIDGAGTNKINAAYFYGGPSETISSVKALTGVDIDHYAEVNFENLVGLVDAIGGVDIVVEEEIDDEDAGGYIPAGEVHLDGEHALIYARSRHFADGDYTRVAHQRQLILAIVEKALTAPATELTGLIQASTEFVTTDSGIDFDFIYSLADQMRHNEKPITINSATIPSSPAYINDVSYVIADTAGVAELMRIFMAGGDVSQEISASSITTDIANAGGSFSSSTGTSIYEEYTYYEPVVTYEETPAAPEAPATPVDTGGADAGTDAGGANAGTGAGDAGGSTGADAAPATADAAATQSATGSA